MADLSGFYNPEAEPSSGFTPLPAGDYELEIVESDLGPTSKGTGTILKTKAQVVGGEYAGRTMFINYNLVNDNTVAEEIGQRDFAGLRRATGVLEVKNSEELHFKTFGVKIGLKARKDTGEMENVIKQYVFDRADNDNTPKPQPARAAASAPAAAKTSPWRK